MTQIAITRNPVDVKHADTIYRMSKRKKWRYAAKLLFQFRVVVDGDPGKRRVCEERTLIFEALSRQTALATAKRKGRAAEYHYQNDLGNSVFFEFVGVQALLCLDPMCGADEVWYDVRQLLTPMERRATIIPSDDALLFEAT